MRGAERAARAIAEATGRGLTMFAAEAWHSFDAAGRPRFDGHKMLIEVDADLPPNVEEIEADIPGFVLIDLAQITARRAEALVVTVP